MVVIIDDRADVWEWSPNLVKVIPCMLKFHGTRRYMRIYLMSIALADDFFVGIGDINSAFLPKVTPLTPSAPPQPLSSPPNPVAPTTSSPSPPQLSTPPPESEMSSETAIHESSPTLVGSDDEELENRTLLTRNSIALEAQVEERPLAKKQEELEEQEQMEEAHNQSEADISKPGGEGVESAEVKVDTTATVQPPPHKHMVKALLRNDDCELLRVKAVRYSYLCLGDSSANENHRTQAARPSSPDIL